MTEVASTLEQKEKFAQLMWTGFILMFFLIQAIIWTVAISLTAGDQSHRILPEYDQRALHWDDEVAKRRASQAMGWQTEFHYDPSGDVQDFHVLSIIIKDRDGQPVSDAAITMTGFHRSYAALPQQIEMESVGPGVYSGKLRVTRSGKWQFEGEASRQDDVFLIEQQLDLRASH